MQTFLWDVRKIILKVYNELSEAEQDIRKEITQSPGWIEKRRLKSGAVALYWLYFQDGVRKAKRIQPGEEEIYETKMKGIAYKKEEYQRIQKELTLIRRCMKVLKIDGTISIERQAENIVKKDVPYAEHLRHPTLKGDYVRSKSEALLANLLYYHKIEYEYEKPAYLKGKKIHPDFTIHLPGNHVLYWEHLGMAGNPEYDQNWSYKNRIYTAAGIGEGNGLIITRDVNGVFDELDALHKIDLYQLSKR